MTGLPDLGRAAFNAAEKALSQKGYIVLNPASLPHGLGYMQYMHIDLAMIDQSDAICMLPGWETSPGANFEKEYARKLGLPVLFYNSLVEQETAKKAISMAV